MKSPSGKAAKILVLDVGGTHVKLLATGWSEPREIEVLLWDLARLDTCRNNDRKNDSLRK